MSSGEQLLKKTPGGSAASPDSRWLLPRQDWLRILRARVDVARASGPRTVNQLMSECWASRADVEAVS